uniref:Small subunit processome component 20 homolog n=2 Tax=Hirondellea gigas TaxID=1518452 RepID=A0A6A7FQ38_9CRUS
MAKLVPHTPKKGIALSNKSHSSMKKGSKKSHHSQKNHANAHTLPKPLASMRVRCMGFAERCRRLSANPIKTIKNQTELEEGEHTHFSTMLEKWKCINLSTTFQNLQRELGYDVQSLAQLLHRHQHIATVLLKYLVRPGTEQEEDDDTAQSLHAAVDHDSKTDDTAGGEVGTDVTVESEQKGLSCNNKESVVRTDDLALISSALIPKDPRYFMKHEEKPMPRYNEDDDAPKALEPVLDLIAALASDIPQHFYVHHFYTFFPHIISHSYIKIPAQIEQVFQCVGSIIIDLKNFLYKDAYKLYVDCFADILSTRRPWYINDLAAQALSFLIRKIPDKELFFYKAFKRLKKNNSQTNGLGRLLTAVMKSNSLNRVHSVTPEILRIVLSMLILKSIPTKQAVTAITLGLKGLAFFVTVKNPQKEWEDLWAEDEGRVWLPVWEHLRKVAGKIQTADKIQNNNDETTNDSEVESSDDDENLNKIEEIFCDSDEETLGKLSTAVSTESCDTDSQNHLHSILTIVQFLINFKRGSLLLDVQHAFDHLRPIITSHSSALIGDCLVNILTDLLKSPNHQACSHQYDASLPLQIQRNKIINLFFESKYPHSVLFSFAKSSVTLRNFDREVMPQLLHYLQQLVSVTTENCVRMEVLNLVLEIIMHHQPPLKSGESLDEWNSYRLHFAKFTPCQEIDEASLITIPAVIQDIICKGLSDDLSNCEDLLTSVMCLPHVSPIDPLEVNPYLAWILNEVLSKLEVAPKTMIDTEVLTPKARLNRKKRALAKSTTEPEEIPLPVLDLNVDVSLDHSSNKLLFLLSALVETMAHTLSREDFLATLSGMNVVTILKSYPQHRENEQLLRAIDIYLTISSGTEVTNDDVIENPITDAAFCDLYQILAPSLASSCAQTRLLVTHILSLFPLCLPPPAKGEEPKEGMFSIMYKVESSLITGVNFNERLRLMSLLDVEHIESRSPVSGMCLQAPILFGLGQFYVNLNPIWGYTVTYLSAFANTMPQDHFWPLWFSKLKLVSHSAHLQLTGQKEDGDSVAAVMFGAESSLTRAHEYLTSHDGQEKLSKRIDHPNVRNLMWKTMHKFPHMSEERGREIVTSFFKFMELEMHSTDFSVAPTENLEKNNFRKNVFEDEDDDTLNESELEENDGEKKGSKKQSRKVGKLVLNSLCNYLALFSKFTNLKCVYMASRLEKLFMDLLVHPSSRVQEHALHCLFAFKHKYLSTYHESLLKIHSDASFKSGVTLFRIDNSGTEDSSIAECDRAKLMPVYIRLLYGKMQTKTGKNTSGRSKTAARKATVMRLLAGIQDDESQCLLDLAFEILLPYLQGSSLEIVQKTFQGIDYTKSIPLRRMMGILGTVDSILIYLGNLIPSKKPYFLKVILLILSQATVLKDRTSGIHPCHINMLKNLKTKATHMLLKFFDTFEDYNWSKEEIEAVFTVVVWPSLTKLPNEGITNIHPMLKIFTKWSETERYHPLFVKHHAEDKSLTPLPYIFSLVTQPKCKVSVINYVLNIVDNLMNSDDIVVATGVSDSEFEKKSRGKNKNKSQKRAKKAKSNAEEDIFLEPGLQLIEFDNLLPVTEPVIRSSVDVTPTYGTKILLPHTFQLMKCMETIVHQVAKNTDRSQLKILCNVTRYVLDNEEGDKLLSLIVPLICKRKTTDPEVVAHLLLTCSHLLPISDNCVSFTRKLLPLYLSVTGQTPRENLTKVFKSLAQDLPKYEILVGYMEGLNSWEVHEIDSIDGARRLETHSQIGDRLKSLDYFDKELFEFLVYQCCYDLTNIKDTTQQEGSLRCLSELFVCITRLRHINKPQFNELMNVIVNQIKQGCKSPIDNVHINYIKLLGIAVQITGQHVKALIHLTDLIKFDEEFFNKMSWFLLVQRTQTLSKLMKAVKNESVVLKSETLETFIWPLVSRYLTLPRYADEPGLLYASVDCMRVISRKLPWNAYLTTLKFFIDLLIGKTTNTRLALKVVSIILEAFHEDVSGLVINDKGNDETKDSVERVSSDKGQRCKSLSTNNVKEQEKLPSKTHAGVESEDKITRKTKVDHIAAISNQDAHSRMVYRSLVQDIIPGLQKVFKSRSKVASNHKLNKQADNDEIKKIPLALPLVMLLKKFPKAVLDANLSNVFYNLITFLTSKVPYVRREARDMMIKILEEVGSKYLPGLIKDMQVNLCRGFQKPVLMYTVRAILVNSVDFLRSDHLCRCLKEIMSMCVNELFANKDVKDKNDDGEQNKVQIHEDKGEKTFAILAVVGRFIMVENMESVLGPLKIVLDTTQRKSVSLLVQKCLENLSTGLEKNKVITLQEKSIFIYGILTDKIALLKHQKKIDIVSRNVWDIPDRRLLDPAPKRIKLSAKTSSDTNSYIFVDFAFVLLSKLLRANDLISDNEDHCALLDPFVGLLGDFIQSNYPDVTVMCLKCFIIMVKFPLPSFKSKIDSLTAQLFVLLNKYSSSELEEGKMFELVQLTFRSLAVVIKSVPFYTMQCDHMRVLLIYMKDNLLKHTHQHTVFSLLQAIVSRKIEAPELVPIMDTVKTMIVKDTTVTILDQARSIYFEYLTSYPLLVKQFAAIIRYFTENLGYDQTQGRVSVCLMVDNIVANIPQKYFMPQHIKCLWLKLLLCLIQEEDDKCRTHQRFSLMTLFANVEDKQFLIKESLLLMKDDPANTRTVNATNIQLGCLSILSFMGNPPEKYSASFFSEVLPCVVRLLHPSKLEPIPFVDNDNTIIAQQLCIDKSLLALLRLFEKLYSVYQTDRKWTEIAGETVWDSIVDHLLYSEFDVRLLSGSLLGKHFAAYPLESKKCPVVARTTQQVRSLVQDFVELFKCEAPVSEQKCKQLCEMTVRNLIYLVRQSPKTAIFADEAFNDGEGLTDTQFYKLQSGIEEVDQYGQVAVSSKWVMNLVSKIASKDINKKKTVRRECLLNLIAGVVLILGDDLVGSGPAVEFIMLHIARERRNRDTDAFVLLVKEISEMVKESLGWEKYSELLNKAEMSLNIRRLARKTNIKARAIRNPERAAKESHKKNIQVKESKKRKSKDGNTSVKRRKLDLFAN